MIPRKPRQRRKRGMIASRYLTRHGIAAWVPGVGLMRKRGKYVRREIVRIPPRRSSRYRSWASWAEEELQPSRARLLRRTIEYEMTPVICQVCYKAKPRKDFPRKRPGLKRDATRVCIECGEAKRKMGFRRRNAAVYRPRWKQPPDTPTP